MYMHLYTYTYRVRSVTCTLYIQSGKGQSQASIANRLGSNVRVTCTSITYRIDAWAFKGTATATYSMFHSEDL